MSWPKKYRRFSLIKTVTNGTYEVLKAMGINVQKEEGPFPLYVHDKVKITPLPRHNSNLLYINFKYGKEVEQ